MAVGAVEGAEDERGLAHESQRERTAGRPIGAQGGDGVRVDVHDPRLAGLCRSLYEFFTGAHGLHRADAAPDLEPAAVEVNIPPPQGQRGPHRRWRWPWDVDAAGSVLPDVTKASLHQASDCQAMR